MEDKFPEQFGPLIEQWERGQAMGEKAAVAWLTENKPGCDRSTGWPAALDWPARMHANVRTVYARWKREGAPAS